MTGAGARRRTRAIRLRAFSFGLGLGLMVATGPAAAQAGPAAVGLQREVIFDTPTPWSRNAEMAARLLSPQTVARMNSGLAQAGKALAEQPIDLSQERFLVYVPARPPPGGYGVIVFIPPWDKAEIPTGWTEVLDRFGVIFVTAARSGNEQSILGRREPLALAAAGNILRRYPVDPARVYVAGLSGGSRVALRVALGYPDVFRGAILNAGSDPIGSLDLPLPPRPLLYRAQSGSRLVYVTGENDAINIDKDAESRLSLQSWCIFDTEEQVMARTGHDVARPAALAQALDALQRPRHPDQPRLDRCRSAREAELEGRRNRAGVLRRDGDDEGARRLLADIDARFGNLTADDPPPQP